MNLVPGVPQHLYAPFYCEENIWHLSREPQLTDFDKRVVFISNEMKSCPLWFQRACQSAHEPVVWDYHVILLANNDAAQSDWQVWDLDTLLGLPMPAKLYLESTFGNINLAGPSFQPQFKVIDATSFATSFCSDRGHMRDRHGAWLVQPPPWPAIMQTSKPNLQELIDMGNDEHGEVLDLPGFVERFASR
jgi:protein N-terminal glutamine amidohydrolase